MWGPLPIGRSSNMCSPFFPDLKTMSSRPATANFTGSLFSAGIEKTLASRQDLRSQICHSLPGGLASATAGGGSSSSFSYVSCVSDVLQEQGRCVGSFSVFLVDGGCPGRSGSVLRVFGRGLWLFPYLVLCSSTESSLWWSLSTVAIFCVVMLRAPTKQRLAFGVEIVTMAIQRSAFRSSYVADLTDLVLLQRNHYGLFMCAGLEWLGIATCFMVVSIKAFIGRVMCCPTRRIQRSLMKINKSLSYWIVKP
ncbi:hypothetical protein HID58_006124 [Brassica napus]|uniref:Transmembrane protein n=1 Tax=Brassica napus TaxID=3708 RepID=A0ABQ8ED21_BRANA|nr:hypothetical protein HID58_006124 [Brassica napus]